MQNKQLIVIGGGAAGFFTAINTASLYPNLQVTILEKTSKLLSKVKISGGGRCNVTHNCFEIIELSKNYPRGNTFLKKAFHQFNTQHTINWFQQRGVEIIAEADGRMFPASNSSQTIIDCFLKEAQQLGIEIKTNQSVTNITKQDEQFYITSNDEIVSADFVCLATGGYPKLEQYNWLANNSIEINAPVPSLFTFNIPNNSITQLMGVAEKNVLVKIKGTKLLQQGPVLITHWGLSGPAVLKLSAFAAIDLHALQYNFTAIVNWLPQFNETSFLQEWKTQIQNTNQITANFNPYNISTRLWQFLIQSAGIDLQSKWNTITKEKVNAFCKLVTQMELAVQGKTTFKEEFVTAGGIVLEQINHTTLEHKQIENLFFAGEVLNIDGITGGFNFQNAWTTGYIAAKTIANRCQAFV